MYLYGLKYNIVSPFEDRVYYNIRQCHHSQCLQQSLDSVVIFLQLAVLTWSSTKDELHSALLWDTDSCIALSGIPAHYGCEENVIGGRGAAMPFRF